MSKGYHTACPLSYGLLKENARRMKNNPTDAERVMWGILRSDFRQYRFRRQHIIEDYIVDFICLPKNLIIEIDGEYHEIKEQQERDEERENFLRKKGYTIIRFTNNQVLFEQEYTINKLKTYLEMSNNTTTAPSLRGRAGGEAALTRTDFQLPGQKSVYHGKVRDVYDLGDLLVMVATDRISAFDVILPKGIPSKGQVLNQIAASFLDATADIVPNWKLATPDPMVTIGKKAEGFRVEMIIRGYLTGSAWREYKAGCRELCGVKLPEGMRENEKFPEPIITPTTKADEGHDLNISKEEIIAQGLVSKEDYETVEKYTRALFARGTEIAAKHGLILVDTKYEFGKADGKVILIDEIHTPDSSRYFYAEGYEEKFEKGEPQKQLSKEFVRQWLIEHNFMNEPGQVVPEMTDEYVDSVSARYIELYEHITGEKFVAAPEADLAARIEKNITEWLTSKKA